MSAGFVLLAGNSAADDIVAAMASLEVEENADGPGAFALTLPINAVDGDLDWVDDPRLAPFASIAVVACGNDDADECVFDGYVLSHKAQLTPGMVGGSLRVWGQDASWLMNLTEKAREWSNASDANVAATIFGDYQISPGEDNPSDDSAAHLEKTHTLIQRGTDAQFLKGLARRSGKLFRVTTGSTPGTRTGIFARPQLGGSPSVSLIVADADKANVRDVEVSWDVMRPSDASGGQALLSNSQPATSSENTGLGLLGERGLADFAGRSSSALVMAAVDEATDLTQRTQGVLVNSGFFVRVTGVADMARLGTVLRVGTLVSLEAAGTTYSGTYYVWSVRHSLTADRHEMRFELVRNALGGSGGGVGGLIGGLLGEIGL